MLTRPKYSIVEVLLWTRLELYAFIIFLGALVTTYDYFNIKFIALPWTPIALIGTAVAFMVGFQNNAAYDRIWEARKIWGGVVNSSRSWGMKIKDMVNNDHAKKPLSSEELKQIHKTLVYRHIAWLTAFRHAMRQPKKWEVLNLHRTNREWNNKIYIPEVHKNLKEDLQDYLSSEELYYVLEKNNRAAALLYLQSKHLRQLQAKGLLWEYSFVDLERLLEELFTLQGKSERIKNFPYPRQFATMGNLFTRIF